MKCTMCGRKLNVFSKDLNRFGASQKCPLCGADAKMNLNWKVFIIYAVVGAAVIAIVNSLTFSSSLFKLAGYGVVSGIAIIQGLELQARSANSSTGKENREQ